MPWFRVPALWLGIFFTLLILGACIHFVYVGHQQAPDQARPNAIHIMGMPVPAPNGSASSGPAADPSP